MNEENIIKNYYSDINHKKFYKKIWGGENIHVGFYESDNINSDSDKIKYAMIKKSEIIYKLINSYINHTNTIKIADFGAGYGGTSRYLYNTFIKDNIKPIIHDYDISFDNCNQNLLHNLESDSNIAVYNLSFLNTYSKDSFYDIIISEDAFLHINYKSGIFNEINRILNINGYLIFSDIIQTSEDNLDNIEEVYERIGINRLETINSYKKLATQNGLIYCNHIEYKDDMLIHYQLIENILKSNKNLEINDESILKGVQNWIKHIQNGNITIVLFIFKKIY